MLENKEQKDNYLESVKLLIKPMDSGMSGTCLRGHYLVILIMEN